MPLKKRYQKISVSFQNQASAAINKMLQLPWIWLEDLKKRIKEKGADYTME